MDEILVIFHSWGTDKSFYKKLIESAPSNWQIFVLDYKDFTKSGKFNDFEEKVLEFLDKHSFKTVNLLGHSLGGALAIKFTHSYPSRIKKMFLVDSEGIYSADTYWQLFTHSSLSNKTYFSKHPLQLLKFIIKIIKRPIWQRRQVEFANNANLMKEAREIKVPTIIFWGEKDKLTPLWQGQKLHELIPSSKFIALKNLSHDWILNDPQLFWKNI